jgi:hypothetical protein
MRHFTQSSAMADDRGSVTNWTPTWQAIPGNHAGSLFVFRFR